MINRDIKAELERLTREYPVVTILGPRQAGKTTLARMFSETYEYSNLEVPETRGLAKEDPKAYLAQFSGNVIIDEVQRVPELLSYIQGIVDEEAVNGRFLLTGSHQLQLREAVSQSLAGRTAGCGACLLGKKIRKRAGAVSGILYRRTMAARTAMMA